MADIREMRIGEKETIAFDWADDLAANEYFVSAEATLDTGLCANGTATIGGSNNTQISQQFTVANNASDGYYKITITGTTDGGNVKKKTFIIRVTSFTAPTVANANYALVRLDEAKDFIGKVTDEDTAIIEMLIESVGRKFNAYCDRALITATYNNEAYDGNGKEHMWLRNYPVTGNITVIEDDTTLTEGQDKDYICYNNEGKLTRLSGVWYMGPKEILVTYTAGYNATGNSITLPHDIRYAALQQIAYEFGRYQRKDLGLDSITYPDGSITRTQTGLLKEVKEILDSHKRWTI